jgi:hypothetical protein
MGVEHKGKIQMSGQKLTKNTVYMYPFKDIDAHIFEIINILVFFSLVFLSTKTLFHEE